MPPLPNVEPSARWVPAQNQLAAAASRTIHGASEDSDARTWDGRTGELLRLLRGHFGSVQAASFSPNGRWILTAGPFTAGLWSAATGQLFPPTGSNDPYLRGPTMQLTSASFAPSGKVLLVSSEDGSVRVYACPVCGGLADLRRLGRALLRDVSAARARPTSR